MDSKPQSEPEDPRLRLAGEQNLLAWVRTGLALMGFGFVVARFGLFLQQLAVVEHTPKPSSTGKSLAVGVCFILLGVVVNVLAAADHYRFLRRLERGEPYRPPSLALSIVVALVLAALGIGMSAFLVLQPL